MLGKRSGVLRRVKIRAQLVARYAGEALDLQDAEGRAPTPLRNCLFRNAYR